MNTLHKGDDDGMMMMMMMIIIIIIIIISTTTIIIIIINTSSTSTPPPPPPPPPPPLEASRNQNIPYKSLPLLLVLSQRNPVRASTSYFFKINFNIIIPFTPRSSK
jgi:heme/copper-type cytochrome/quinol oxidase subunit 2